MPVSGEKIRWRPSDDLIVQRTAPVGHNSAFASSQRHKSFMGLHRILARLSWSFYETFSWVGVRYFDDCWRPGFKLEASNP